MLKNNRESGLVVGLVNNPILSVEDTLWYWTNPLFVNWQGAGQKISRNKIAAGVPIYGYDFAYGKDPDDLSGQVPPGYKSIRYKDILAQFPDAHTAANASIKISGVARDLLLSLLLEATRMLTTSTLKLQELRLQN